METDALQMKLSLLSADYRLAVLCGITHDLRVSLQEDFISASVVHVSRFCNEVGHELAARLGTTNQVEQVYASHDVPIVVSNLAVSVLMEYILM